MICDRISDDIPPQMRNLNMVIPIQMHYCSLSRIGTLQASCHPMKCDIINDVKLFLTDTVQIVDILQSDVVLHKQVHNRILF